MIQNLKNKNMKNFIKRNSLVLLSILVLVLISSIVFFYFKSVYVNDANTAEIKSLVKKVGKHMILPKGEMPSVSSISDPELLKNVVFFEGAKSGDRVLIYNKSKKAILYDEENDKIVNIAPVIIEVDKNNQQTVRYSF